MTLMELVPARVACGMLLSSTLLASGTPDAQAAKPRTPAAKTQRTEAASANPPSYDVLGKRYRVLASAAGYRERGIASWYGHPFDGRPTSSGERYDMHEMTAAHRSLPLPTWVEVTNLDNGKRVVVKVNDRGPFVGKRLIDLSFAAATKLDIVQNGTARVEVHALPGPPPETTADRRDRRDQNAKPSKTGTPSKPAAPRAPPKPQPSPDSSRRATEQPQLAKAQKPTEPPPADSALADSEGIFAEAGRFRSRAEAVDLVASLRAEGMVNAFVVTEDGRHKSLHRVRVGPLDDAAAVDSMNHKLRELGARRSHSVTMR